MAELPPVSSSNSAQAFESITIDTSVSRVTINQEHQLDPEPEKQKDIYRGEPPSPRRSRPPSVISSTTSSSAGWSVLGLRRGALGAILETAINRWARTTSDSSSSTSSSPSLRSRLPRKRARRSSIATSHNTNTEIFIRARRKAWEQGRVLPREFVLFLPATLTLQAADNDLDHFTQERRLLRSTSLPLVLSQLDSAIKRSARQRKNQPKIISPGALEKRSIDNIRLQPSHSFQGRIPGNDNKVTSEDSRIHKQRSRAAADKSSRRPAWWLDVSSPTWSDMREIGKLLHLHPLALEDILHQEPREKLEVFPRLGYYFIVFRALDSELTRSKARTQLDLTMKGDKMTVPFTDGGIGATNVYIVVFREGICTFHFEDISDHTSRVRNRIMHFEDNFNMTSDWIAHGLLDSIVDQFFPLLNSIEREVKAFDDLVLSITGPLLFRPQIRQIMPRAESVKEPSEKAKTKLDLVNMEISEKTNTSSFDEAPMSLLRFVRPISWGAVYIRRLVPTSTVWKLKHWSTLSQRKDIMHSPPPLMRMASTRRLVTSLTRLLGTKSDVVSQIRKRMSGKGLTGLNVHFPEQNLAGEVDIYLGDIQDHILTLQQSLAHYERMLSHSHPAYISHIRVSLAQAKAVKDHKLFMLTLLAVGIMAMQVVIGAFSTNVGNMPRNNRHATPIAPFNWFMGLIAFVLLVFAGVVFLARYYWWRQAERKYAHARQSKF